MTDSSSAVRVTDQNTACASSAGDGRSIGSSVRGGGGAAGWFTLGGHAPGNSALASRRHTAKTPGRRSSSSITAASLTGNLG